MPITLRRIARSSENAKQYKNTLLALLSILELGWYYHSRRFPIIFSMYSTLFAVSKSMVRAWFSFLHSNVITKAAFVPLLLGRTEHFTDDSWRVAIQLLDQLFSLFSTAVTSPELNDGSIFACRPTTCPSSTLWVVRGVRTLTPLTIGT